MQCSTLLLSFITVLAQLTAAEGAPTSPVPTSSQTVVVHGSIMDIPQFKIRAQSSVHPEPTAPHS